MKISVIVPVYNVEQYIEECLVSLVNQTFKNFEIIIVNDGTKDKSIEKIQKLIDNHDNIQIINQKNAGLSAARNTGLKQAKGKYVSFIDSDDWIEPNFLNNLYKVAELNNLDIVCAGHKKVYGNSDKNYELRKRSTALIRKQVLSGEEALLYQYKKSEYRMEVWDDLYRRQFLLENNLKFEEDFLHEDEMFTPLAMIRANKVQFIEDTSYCYRQRENSIMSGTKDQKRAKSLYIVAEKLASYLDLVKEAELKTYIAISAKQFYHKSVVLGNKAELSQNSKIKIIKNLGKEKTIKDNLIINTPKVASVLYKLKKVIRNEKK